MEHRFGVVILAAGASTRLGQPKQVVSYKGTSLVEHAVRTALDSGASEVVVVVGANSDSVVELLESLSVLIVYNTAWAEGMGSSIRCGVGALSPAIECAVIALCDQPQITAEVLRTLAQRHFETGAPIVASSYDGVIGAPSAFGSDLFSMLKALKGDSGARELIRRSSVPIERVEFDGGNLDVDTPQDLKRLESE